MRLAQLIFLVCLVIFASTDAVSRVTFFSPTSTSSVVSANYQKVQKTSNSPASVKNKNKNKNTNSLCSYFPYRRSYVKNSSKIFDDKRVVPTGPNPLHNK